MKIRYGFVSNSSSSSFIIRKSQLSEEQLEKLYSVCDSPIGSYSDEWNIHEDGNFVRGSTYMDNGQDEDGLEAWLKENGYPMGHFTWDRD